MTRDPLAKFLPVAIAVLGLAVLVFVVRRFSAEPAGADAAGYFNDARLLASGQLTEALRMPTVLNDPYPYDFEPLGFHYDTPTNRLVPTYFVGLPLLLALGHALVGWHYAPYLVELGFGLLTLACCYRLQRELGIHHLIALTVAANLAWCPVFIFGTTQPYSDTVATGLCALAALGAVKGARAGTRWHWIAGASLGLAIMVRSTSALLFPALMLLASDAKGRRAIIMGCVPLGLLLAGYQQSVYGSAFRSGYGDIFRIFDPAYLRGSLFAYATRLPLLLPIAAFALAGLLPSNRLLSGRITWALVLWVLPFMGFYAFYVWTGQDWTYLRFVEPVFPALLVLAGAGLRYVAARFTVASHDPERAPAIAACFALAVALLVAVLSHYPNPRAHDRGSETAQRWIRSSLPPQALVICESFSGTLYFMVPNPILRWDISATRNNLKYLKEMTAAGLPVYAVLDESEANDPLLHQKVPGRWEKVADLSTASVWRVFP